MGIFIHPWSPVTAMWQFNCWSIHPLWPVTGSWLGKQHYTLLKGLEKLFFLHGLFDKEKYKTCNMNNSLSNILQLVTFKHQFRRFPCTNIVEYSKTKPLFWKCKGLKSFKGLSLVEKMNILTISMCLLYSHTEANYSIS